MRGVCRSGPKYLAVYTSLNARRFSVRAEIPGDSPQCECEAFFGQTQNSWRYLPFWMLGVFRSVANVNAMCLSQCECEVFVGQNRNSWRYFPVKTRGVFRPDPQFECDFRPDPRGVLRPKFLAISHNLNARRFSARPKIPGGTYHFGCEAFFGQ